MPFMSDWSDEETDDPLCADRRNFYKVEKWSGDGLRVMVLLYAGNNLDKARRIFERTTPAAYPADDPPAHASVRRVATARNVALIPKTKLGGSPPNRQAAGAAEPPQY
jgi:hypothetical protein